MYKQAANRLCTFARRCLGSKFNGHKDIRSQRILVTIECILNQNARDCGAATFADMNWEALRLCKEHGVGIFQMPCPEMVCLGFQRKRNPNESIRDILDTENGRKCCRKISYDVAELLHDYINQDYRILAILGGNPQSPGCAVHEGPEGLLPSSGIFMQELYAELLKRRIHIPFRGIRDSDPQLLKDDLKWLEKILSA